MAVDERMEALPFTRFESFVDLPSLVPGVERLLSREDAMVA
jgi:hypothetical protein